MFLCQMDFLLVCDHLLYRLVVSLLPNEHMIIDQDRICHLLGVFRIQRVLSVRICSIKEE